jgi:hypothetical protein
MIKIDKNVPVPNNRNKYPWSDLKVGDSFYVDRDISWFRTQVSRANATRKPKHFVIRKEGDGCRIWRDK